MKKRFPDCLTLFHDVDRFCFLNDDAEKAAEVLDRMTQPRKRWGQGMYNMGHMIFVTAKDFQDVMNRLCAKDLKIVTFAFPLTKATCADALPTRIYTAGTALDRPSTSLASIKRIGHGNDASFAFTLLNRMNASCMARFRFGLLKDLPELRTFLTHVRPQEIITEEVLQKHSLFRSHH